MFTLSVTEIIKPYLDDMAVMFARQYKQNGKVFIDCFRKYTGQRMALGFTVKNFEDNVMAYEPDEKIVKYVDGLKLENRESDLLKRVLSMIRAVMG